MALAAEHIQYQTQYLSQSNLLIKVKNQQQDMLTMFQLTDPIEIGLRQNEFDCYDLYQKGISWYIPQRILQVSNINTFHLFGDPKSKITEEMEIAGHEIRNWQFNYVNKMMLRIASYAKGHHPGFGVLINNGMSERQNEKPIGKETVIERTIYYDHPDGLKIVDDRFVTRYPEEIELLIKEFKNAHFEKNENKAKRAKSAANALGYEFEFHYSGARVVIPGSAREYPKYGSQSYFST